MKDFLISISLFFNFAFISYILLGDLKATIILVIGCLICFIWYVAFCNMIDNIYDDISKYFSDRSDKNEK